MAAKSTRGNGSRRRQPVRVRAGAVGDTRIPPSTRDQLVHPDATPLHQIPKDNDVEAALSKIENLLGKGHYGAALQQVDALTFDDSPLTGHYHLIRHEKLSRAQLGIADRYFIRGDVAQARTFYQRVLEVETATPTVKRITRTAGQIFDNLLTRRKRLIDGLRRSIRTSSFDQWCDQKKDLGDFTMLDVRQLRDSVAADYQMERIFGERPPIVPQPGFISPLPPESDSVDSASALPGSVFRSLSEGLIDVDIDDAGSSAPGPNNRIRASLAMPLIANVMTAQLRLFALDNGLNLAGQASGTVPLFRYEYLRDKAKQTIAHIQQVESRCCRSSLHWTTSPKSWTPSAAR